MVKHHKILIFASGSGTNAEQIIRHFSPNPIVEVLGVYSNNPSAAVLERAKQLGVSTRVFNREQLNNSEDLLKDYPRDHPRAPQHQLFSEHSHAYPLSELIEQSIVTNWRIASRLR